MNRKLHNSLLAASTTGLALVFGLLLASPVSPPARPLSAAAPAGDVSPLAGPVTRLAKVEARRALLAVQTTHRASASARLEHDVESPTEAASLIAGIATEVAIEAALAGLDPDVEAACAGDAEPAERRVRRSRARDAFATPYFSFAHGMRDGTGA